MSTIEREIETALYLVEKLNPNHGITEHAERVGITVDEGCKAACLLITVLEAVENVYCAPVTAEIPIPPIPPFHENEAAPPVPPVPPVPPTPLIPILPPLPPELFPTWPTGATVDEFLSGYEAHQNTFLDHIHSLLKLAEGDACTILSVAIGIVKSTENKVCVNHE